MNTLFVIGVLCACAAAEPSESAEPQLGPVDVQVELDPSIIPFHRKAQYSIVVEAPNDVQVQIPEMVDNIRSSGTSPST